jgi:hypothetical protein
LTWIKCLVCLGWFLCVHPLHVDILEATLAVWQCPVSFSVVSEDHLYTRQAIKFTRLNCYEPNTYKKDKHSTRTKNHCFCSETNKKSRGVMFLFRVMRW